MTMNYDLMIEDDLPGDDEIVLNDKKSKLFNFPTRRSK